MSALTQKVDDAAMAEDLCGLLDHIAWTDVLRPKLLAAKEAASSRLTAAVLGNAPVGEKRAEQLAGMVYGIDTVIRAVETILRNGASAEAFLRSNGINLG